MSYTREPWKEVDGLLIRPQEDNFTIVEVPVDRRDARETPGNLKRIVACVNACEGIPTDSLNKLDVRNLLQALGQLEKKVEEEVILIEDAVEAIIDATKILVKIGEGHA
ncbi:MAG: hypothetical protein ACETWG_13400 [Candidatus Neomarinimicrobiota bacterium]